MITTHSEELSLQYWSFVYLVNITMKPTPKFIGFIQWRIKNVKAIGMSLPKSILKYGIKLNVFGKGILVYFVLHI